MFVVGLTGGIGSGKSTVAALFAELGVPVVDTDIIAREVVAPGQPGLREIVDHFGTTILREDGTLNRAALRERVYSDRNQRKLLERLLHPRIRERMLTQIAALHSDYCLAVIPLLMESGQQHVVDRILVVDLPRAEQIKRVMARDSLSRPQVEAVLAAQTTRRQRLTAADDVIANTGAPANLRAQVVRLDAEYRRLAAGARHGRR
ncbi:MAG: dephospho-CoA kinase [Chromatiales bacterium]|nr:dephospho-CoA kinase [Chromatiales bacterium]